MQLRVPTTRGIDQELLEKVHNLVKEKIEECNNYKFDVGFKCENGVFNDKKEDSFVALEEFSVEESMCPICPVSKKHYLGKEMCWVCQEFVNFFEFNLVWYGDLNL